MKKMIFAFSLLCIAAQCGAQPQDRIAVESVAGLHADHFDPEYRTDDGRWFKISRECRVAGEPGIAVPVSDYVYECDYEASEFEYTGGLFLIYPSPIKDQDVLRGIFSSDLPDFSAEDSDYESRVEQAWEHHRDAANNRAGGTDFIDGQHVDEFELTRGRFGVLPWKLMAYWETYVQRSGKINYYEGRKFVFNDLYEYIPVVAVVPGRIHRIWYEGEGEDAAVFVVSSVWCGNRSDYCGMYITALEYAPLLEGLGQ